jgi:hypothetical protein
MPEEPVVVVKAHRVTPKAFGVHAGHKVSPGRLDHEMKVIAHQTPGVDLPIGFLAGVAQRFQKQFAVFVRAKNRLLMIAAVITW